jgi:hypothetical protein|tara:strand:- start:125 stop:1003 length:879 start_codon:yes stop_codon:yes gene_type:complete
MKKLDIRSVLIGVLCTALVFVLIGAKSQSGNLGDIVVNSITVLDENGNIVGQFSSIENSGVIALNKAGNLISLLLTSGGGGQIMTKDSQGDKTTCVLGSNSSGDKGSLFVYGSKNKRGIELTGDLGIALFDPEENLACIIEANQINGGRIATFNSNKKYTTIVGTSKDGFGGVTTFNTDGELLTYQGRTGKNNYGGQFVTYSFNGKVTSSLGAGINGEGYLLVSNNGSIITENSDDKQTTFLGTDEGDGGILKTFNKHGVFVGYFGSNKDGDGVAVLSDRYGDAGWGVDGKQ